MANLLELKTINDFRMWTIYDRPRDYPDEFVARVWLIDQSGQLNPGELVARAESQLTASPQDDPCIVETWV